MFEDVKHDGDSLVIAGTKRVRTYIGLGPRTTDQVATFEYRYHDVTYEVSISARGIEDMVDVAFRNRGRRAKDGPVSVKVLDSTAAGCERVESVD